MLKVFPSINGSGFSYLVLLEEQFVPFLEQQIVMCAMVKNTSPFINGFIISG